MITAIAVLLLIVWAGGLAASSTMGGFVHLLLVVGVVMLFVRLFQGPKVLASRSRLSPKEMPS